MQPLVSFIIPCYNQGQLLLETLLSVQKQEYVPIEVIVVNDGSTDANTLDVLSSLPESIRVIHIENSGPSVARNIAVAASSGRYIVPLDGDDLILPETLQIAIPVLEQNSSLAVVYGNNELFGERSEVKVQAPFNSTQIFMYNTIAFCSVIRKSAYEAVGGLDEWMSKKGLEDWEFWIRLFSHGWKFQYINQTFFKIRVQQSSRTYQVANKNLTELKDYVWRKNVVALGREYERLYHDCKATKQNIGYRIGRCLLYPARVLKQLLAVK